MSVTGAPVSYAVVLPRRRRSTRARVAVLATAGLVAGLLSTVPTGRAHAAEPDIAVGAVATASSVENAGTPAANAVDGDLTTRWGSAWADPQSLQVDLGAQASISGVVLQWEAAFGVAYTVDVSADATAWTTVATET